MMLVFTPLSFSSLNVDRTRRVDELVIAAVEDEDDGVMAAAEPAGRLNFPSDDRRRIDIEDDDCRKLVLFPSSNTAMSVPFSPSMPPLPDTSSSFPPDAINIAVDEC